MATSCGYECQCKSFRFVDCDESKFYEFQWSKCKLTFVLYRALVCFYHWGWIIASWVLAKPDIYYTVSNWSFFFTGIYFAMAFGTSLYGIINRKDYTETDRNAVDSKVNAMSNGNNAEKPVPAVSSSDNLRWFHRTTWFFHALAFTFVLFVTILYWGILARNVSIEKLKEPLGQHKHSVQGFLMLLDMFLIAFPTRILHFVYPVLIAFFFSIFLVIMHFAGVDSAAYPITDFANSPKLAAGMLVGSTFVAPVIFHTVNFGLYHLRALIYRKTVGKQVEATKSAQFDKGHDNVTFNEA